VNEERLKLSEPQLWRLRRRSGTLWTARCPSRTLSPRSSHQKSLPQSQCGAKFKTLSPMFVLPLSTVASNVCSPRSHKRTVWHEAVGANARLAIHASPCSSIPQRSISHTLDIDASCLTQRIAMRRRRRSGLGRWGTASPGVAESSRTRGKRRGGRTCRRRRRLGCRRRQHTARARPAPLAPRAILSRGSGPTTTPHCPPPPLRHPLLPATAARPNRATQRQTAAAGAEPNPTAGAGPRPAALQAPQSAKRPGSVRRPRLRQRLGANAERRESRRGGW